MLKVYDILANHGLRINPEIQKINDYLSANLTSYRYEHSLRTLEFSLRLAGRENIGVKLIYNLATAALAHDITKERSPDFHKALFKKYNRQDFADLPVVLYHSKSAPFVLLEEFNIVDPIVSHAVSFHSTGCADMPLFSRIVFCADYLASFNFSGDEEGFEKMLQKPLADLCIEKIRSTIGYLLSEKLPVQPESINFYNNLIYE